MQQRSANITSDNRPARRRTAGRRAALAVSAVVTIGAGLSVRFAGRGLAADFAGDALYAVLVFLVVGFFVVRASSWSVGLIAVVVCWAIETFQLTGLPSAAAYAFPPSALLLGTGFSPVDLLAYALGVTLAATVDASARRRDRRSRNRDTARRGRFSVGSADREPAERPPSGR